MRIVLELEVRRIACRVCASVKRERLDFLADNPHFTKRFAFYVGRRCRQAAIRDVAKELKLDWETVKSLEMQYMRAQIERAGAPGPRAIGIDEISIRKGHSLSHRGQRPGAQEADLVRRRGPFRGEHGAVLRLARAKKVQQNQARRDGHVEAVPERREGQRRRKRRSCSTSSTSCAISARPSTRSARRNTPASAARTGASSRARSTRCCRVDENLSLEGRRSLELLLAANKRLNTAYVLKESFGQLWDYQREGWARRFFDNWRASLKWQRLKPYERFAEMIDRHWDGIAAYCKPENKVSLGFVEGLNNKIRVFQRRAYGLRDEEYLRLKVLSCMLPPI